MEVILVRRPLKALFDLMKGDDWFIFRVDCGTRYAVVTSKENSCPVYYQPMEGFWCDLSSAKKYLPDQQRPWGYLSLLITFV